MKLTGSLVAAFRIGLASARANLVPMVVLWTLAGASVGAYYLLASFREMIEPLADWQRAWGWRAAFVSQAVFCGILPGEMDFVSDRPIQGRSETLVGEAPRTACSLRTSWTAMSTA